MKESKSSQPNENNEHNQTTLNFQKYKQMHPQTDININTDSNIFSMILTYFSLQNITISLSGVDIFNQEQENVMKQTKTNGGETQSFLLVYFRQYIDAKKQENISNQQKNRNNKKTNSQGKYGTVVNFIEYLITNLQEQFQIKWKDSDAISENDHERHRQSINEKNQFQIDNQNDKIDEQNKLSKNQLDQKSFFTILQKKYLFDYYKYFCEQQIYYPKGKTFDDLKQLYKTMNLPQWMRFCQKANIVINNTQFRNTHHISQQYEISISILKTIFQKRQQCNKKMSFDNFCNGIADIINIIEQKNKLGEFTGNYVDSFEFLGLKNQSNHNENLDKMGIKYIREKVYFSNLSTVVCQKSPVSRSSHYFSRSVLIQKSLNKNQNKKISGQKLPKIQKSKQWHSQQKSEKQEQKTKNSNLGLAKKKQIKFYRSRNERKQSEMLKKLKISNFNLNQISPSDDVLYSFQKAGITFQDDQFLREYNRKQNKINKGVLNRIDKKINIMNKKIR